MLSAIQHRPVNIESFTWNLPKPKAFTACDTVYDSANIKKNINTKTQIKRSKNNNCKSASLSKKNCTKIQPKQKMKMNA